MATQQLQTVSLALVSIILNTYYYHETHYCLVDINECFLPALFNCSKFEVCENEVGSFRCNCIEGYEKVNSDRCEGEGYGRRVKERKGLGAVEKKERLREVGMGWERGHNGGREGGRVGGREGGNDNYVACITFQTLMNAAEYLVLAVMVASTPMDHITAPAQMAKN
jgi:hypothetical protein